jgi:hypothetical protein
MPHDAAAASQVRIPKPVEARRKSGGRVTTSAVLAFSTWSSSREKTLRVGPWRTSAPLFEQLGLLRGPTLGGDADRHPFERTVGHESILAPPPAAPNASLAGPMTSAVLLEKTVDAAFLQANA